MKQVIILIIIGIYSLFPTLKAQKTEKRPLTINDFATWNVIVNPLVSNDGKYAAFEQNPQKGDGKLIIKSTDGKSADTLARGYDARFSPESDYIVYKIKQPVDSVRLAKKKKLKKEQMPKDSLGIFILKDKTRHTFPNLKKFAVSKENSTCIAFTIDSKKSEKKNENQGKTESVSKEKKSTKSQSEDDLAQLVIFRPETGDTINFSNVSEFFCAPQGRNINFIRQTKDSVTKAEVISFDTSKKITTLLFRQSGTAKKISCDEQGLQHAFLFSADTIKEKTFGLYYRSQVENTTRQIIIKEGSEMPLGWSPSEFSEITFSEDGRRIYFGTNKKPVPEAKDSLLEDEKPMLDIWTWKDKELQPEQKLNIEKEKKRTYKAVYLIGQEKFIQLGDPNLREVRTYQKGNGRYALGIDQSPYQLASSWTGRSNSDYYLIEIETGNRQKVAEAKQSVSLSPGGNFIVWYNPEDSSYYSRSTNLNLTDIIKLNKQIPAKFCDERWDMPGEASPYGIAGWSENDQYVFLYDRFDIWRIDPTGSKVPVNATRNYGRNNSLSLRYQKTDPEEEFIDTSKPVVVSAFDEETKAEGYFNADLRNFTDPRLLMMEDYRFEKLMKAKNAPIYLWTRENVNESPAIWTGNQAFENKRRLSDANPQQKSFVWPGVRLVHWETFSGKKLEGLLYFPETIDPEKKYPLVVYFYERNADNLHVYTPPSPTRSTVNRSYFASNDYIVFIPDITYEEGYPGQSAYDAVVSGTQFVSNMFPFIDHNRIGIQGQSWGGYQTAWLITQTNMFAAAMAGAPVSNMTSAYGGIRWESGKSRMYQYEQSQSRIGGTVWDKPMQFIENSPLFYVPKIKTPLLIMHNDNDGAVPWYQGIELFTAMRRLNKPVWLLSYNNEEHNLKAESWANRMDLTIRMKQFFDHYLKGQTMPAWMKSGIPAVKKGKDLGY